MPTMLGDTARPRATVREIIGGTRLGGEVLAREEPIRYSYPGSCERCGTQYIIREVYNNCVEIWCRACGTEQYRAEAVRKLPRRVRHVST